MKIKTSSGFECNINERCFNDWRYIQSMKKVQSGEDALIIDGITSVVSLVLGKEEQRLIEHIADGDGFADTTKLVREFNEIVTIAGEKVKKSKPSPD